MIEQVLPLPLGGPEGYGTKTGLALLGGVLTLLNGPPQNVSRLLAKLTAEVRKYLGAHQPITTTLKGLFWVAVLFASSEF